MCFLPYFDSCLYWCLAYICEGIFDLRIYAKHQYRIRARKYVVHYTFQHMSTITKLSSDVAQYYKNITSPIRANVRIQRDVQVWTVQMMLTSLQKKNSRETQRGPRRIGLWTVCWGSTLQLRISDQQPRESTSSKLRDLDMRIQESKKLPNEWCGECQVACRDKHACIDKFELK